MESKNIKISTEALDLLKNIKKRNTLKTYDNTIKKMCLFFIENCVSPNAKIGKNIETLLKNFHVEYVKRDDSFRKWIGMIYHKEIFTLIDDQKQLVKKYDELYRYLVNNEASKLQIEFAKEWLEKNKNMIKTETYNADYIESQSRERKLIQDIKDRDEIIAKDNKKLAEYKKTINFLLEEAVKSVENDEVYYTIKLSKFYYELLAEI